MTLFATLAAWAAERDVNIDDALVAAEQIRECLRDEGAEGTDAEVLDVLSHIAFQSNAF